jgi:hypothetical protein
MEKAKKTNILKFDDLDYHKIFGTDTIEPNDHLYDEEEGICDDEMTFVLRSMNAEV